MDSMLQGRVRPPCSTGRHGQCGRSRHSVISMEREARSNRSGRIHDLHEVGKSKCRMKSDGEVNNTIEGIFEEAVVAADSLRDAAKLLEVGANVIDGEQTGTADTLTAVMESQGAHP
jgi:hypothetical protein